MLEMNAAIEVVKVDAVMEVVKVCAVMEVAKASEFLYAGQIPTFYMLEARPKMIRAWDVALQVEQKGILTRWEDVAEFVTAAAAVPACEQK